MSVKVLTLAVKDYTVGYKNKKIQLRPREFKLMELLLINAGQICRGSCFWNVSGV